MAHAGSKAANPLQQFLTPEAMLTPGVAGALTMMITNTLAVSFNAPRAWIGLALSFVFGLLVLVSTKQLIVKGAFYVLNSLVIFCVAVGASGLGSGSQQAFNYFGINSAFAQGGTSVGGGAADQCANLSARIADAQKNGASSEQIVKLVEPCENVHRDLLKSGVDKKPPQSTKFFAPWRF